MFRANTRAGSESASSVRRVSRRRFLGSVALSSLMAAVGSSVSTRPILAASDAPGWIILTRGRDIVMTRPDGSETRTVLSVNRGEFVFDVALSPDGTRMAYGYFTTPAGTGGGGSDIMVATISPTVGEPTLLAGRDGPGTLLGTPGWTPDGHSVVFESIGLSPVGVPTFHCDGIEADGSGRQVLVDSARYPAISPDGKSLAYVKSQPTGDSLWVRPLNGGPERQIVSDDAMAGIFYPRFAPDGSQIAFAGVTLMGVRPRAVGVELLRLDLATADASQPVRTAARHGLPTDPWVVAPDGSGLRRVGQISGDDLAVAWSPDGQWLAVSGAYGLAVLAVGDGTERDVSEDGSTGAIDWR